MVSYILITEYSILLFMNPLNFKLLQVLWTLPTFFLNKKRLENKKNVKKRDQNKKT